MFGTGRFSGLAPNVTILYPMIADIERSQTRLFPISRNDPTILNNFFKVPFHAWGNANSHVILCLHNHNTEGGEDAQLENPRRDKDAPLHTCYNGLTDNIGYNSGFTGLPRMLPKFTG